jgi:hypothetical protein
MIVLSTQEMLAQYFVSALTAEFENAEIGYTACFLCKDPQIHELLVHWFNTEPREENFQIMLISSKIFRFAIKNEQGLKFFQLTLLSPKGITVELLEG